MLCGWELWHCVQWVLLYEPGMQANRIHFVQNAKTIGNDLGSDSIAVENGTSHVAGNCTIALSESTNAS